MFKRIRNWFYRRFPRFDKRERFLSEEGQSFTHPDCHPLIKFPEE